MFCGIHVKWFHMQITNKVLLQRTNTFGLFLNYTGSHLQRVRLQRTDFFCIRIIDSNV